MGLVQLVDTQEWGSCQWGFDSLIPHHKKPILNKQKKILKIEKITFGEKHDK